MTRSPWLAAGRIAAGGLGGAAVLGGLLSLGAATVFARRVLTPPDEMPTDLEVLAVDDARSPSPGRSTPRSWAATDSGRRTHRAHPDGTDHGHDADHRDAGVLGTDFGVVGPGPVRFNQYFTPSPGERWATEVTIDAEIGALRHGRFRRRSRPTGGQIVHGRSAAPECPRPCLHGAGLTS